MLSFELPTGRTDVELPSGLTTLLIVSDMPLSELRKSTTLVTSFDLKNYFEGEVIDTIDTSVLGIICDCGKLLSE